MRIKIKAISVNQAWNTYCQRCKSAKTVRRTKTDKYKGWDKHLTLLLPPLKNDFKGHLRLDITFGYSSHGSDIDNALKPLLDVLQKKWQFNDNQIYELMVKKEIVPKGKEFIDIEIQQLSLLIKSHKRNTSKPY